MSSRAEDRSSRNSRFISAPREAVYAAFLDPDVLARWLAPEGMTGRIHAFDGQVGGGYRMSLYYSGAVMGSPGKTAELEDRFIARFVELSPPDRIVQAVTFDSTDEAFSGEMLMAVRLDAENDGTRVTIEFTRIPPGIRPQDNQEGTRQSLDKLARLLE